MVFFKCFFISIFLIIKLSMKVVNASEYNDYTLGIMDPPSILITQAQQKCFVTLEQTFQGYNNEYFYAVTALLQLRLNDIPEDENSLIRKYYMQFEHFLVADYVDCPKRFCFMRTFNDARLFSECSDQLKLFSEDPTDAKAALLKAFYDLRHEDFPEETKPFARYYMLFLSRKIDVNDTMEKPSSFCFSNYPSEEEYKGTRKDDD